MKFDKFMRLFVVASYIELIPLIIPTFNIEWVTENSLNLFKFAERGITKCVVINLGLNWGRSSLPN